jgi:hypothetical protein
MKQTADRRGARIQEIMGFALTFGIDIGDQLPMIFEMLKYEPVPINFNLSRPIKYGATKIERSKR